MRWIYVLGIVLLSAAFSVSAAQLTACGDELGHFRDEFGNAFCLSGERPDYFGVEDQVCSLDNLGV